MECCVCFNETTQTITDCCSQYLCRSCFAKVDICPACRDVYTFKPAPKIKTHVACMPCPPLQSINQYPTSIYTQYSRMSTGEIRYVVYGDANVRMATNTINTTPNTNTTTPIPIPTTTIINCPCGSTIKRKSLASHQRTKKHLAFANPR